jgi:hypothetical protein
MSSADSRMDFLFPIYNFCWKTIYSAHIHYFLGEVSPRKNLINVYYNWIEAWDELLNIEFN